MYLSKQNGYRSYRPGKYGLPRLVEKDITDALIVGDYSVHCPRNRTRRVAIVLYLSRRRPRPTVISVEVEVYRHTEIDRKRRSPHLRRHPLLCHQVSPLLRMLVLISMYPDNGGSVGNNIGVRMFRILADAGSYFNVPFKGACFIS